jgi:LPPG:FO 2-phospho-L-lactate transferase
MICVLTGGTGGAKFVDGLRQVMPAEEITLIVNTGDDLLWWGLYVSPDIDSITYVLSGMLSRERGWGVKGDTFLCLQAMGQLGEPTWFHTGDRDLAMHLLRSRHMAEGKTLSEATAIVSDKLGVKARILPMSDSRVETRIGTPVGELSFEEYFVQRWYQDPVNSVRFAGASDAEPAPGVIEAIEAADAILIAPSNPVTSIGPILAVPGIREALCRAKGKIGAISPIISGAPVNGPAGILMVAQGLPSSIAGVAQAYEDFLDVLICDTRDARPAEVLRKTGMRVQCAQTIMRTPEDKAELARKALALVSASPVSEQGAAGPTSLDRTSLDQTSSGQSFSDEAAPDKAASEQTPVERAPVERAPVERAPVEQAPAEQAPAEQAPAGRPFVRFHRADDRS